jgi:threonine aldolase
MTAADLTARCKEAGLWISALGPHYARLVTHLDFDDAQCDAAIEILKRALVVK